MREWIKLFENEDDDGPSQWEREQAVERAVKQTCERLGLSFHDSSRPVMFIEDDSEVTIYPDDDEITLQQLEALKVYGDRVSVTPRHQGGLVIRIQTHEGLVVTDQRGATPRR